MRRVRRYLGNVSQNQQRKRTHHLNNLGVYVISNHTPLSGDILQHFVQSLSLNLLALELRVGVVEVEQNCALMQFLDEELWSFGWRSF